MARDFDGTDDNINCGAGTHLENLNPFTFCAWIYITSNPPLNEYDNICSKANPVDINETYPAYINTDNSGAYIGVWSGYDVTNANALSPVDHFSTGQWWHVTTTFDSAATNNCSIFRNAVEVPSYSTRTNASGNHLSDATENFNIGDDGYAGYETSFNGRIAEVMIFNTILTTTEMGQIMRGYHPMIDNRVGYWPIYGTTSPEPDFSGRNSHGTVTGTTRIDHPPGIGMPWISGKKYQKRPDRVESQLSQPRREPLGAVPY